MLLFYFIIVCVFISGIVYFVMPWLAKLGHAWLQKDRSIYAYFSFLLALALPIFGFNWQLYLGVALFGDSLKNYIKTDYSDGERWFLFGIATLATIAFCVYQYLKSKKSEAEIKNEQDKTAFSVEDYSRLTKRPVGRETSVVAIASAFKKSQFVAIAGEGGRGKTTLAKYFIDRNRKKYDNIIWINQKESLAESFYSNNELLEKLNMREPVQVLLKAENYSEEAKKTVLLKILQKIKEKEGKLLLVFDVQGSKDSTSFQTEIYNQFNQVDYKTWHVLVTTRDVYSQIPPIEEFKKLVGEDLLILFRRFYTKKIDANEQQALFELFDTISYHELTTEMLAAHADYMDWSVETLVQKFTPRLNALKTNIDSISHAHNERIVDVVGYLQAVFDMADLSDELKAVLYRISFFTIETEEKVAHKLLEGIDDFNLLLRGLIKKSWLKYDAPTKTYIVHAMQKMAIQRQIPEPKNLVLAPLVSILDSIFLEFKSNLDTVEKVAAYLHIVDDLLTEIKDDESEQIARLYNNVGISYEAKGDIDKSLEYAKKALKIHEAILPPNHPDLAMSYNNVGVAYKAKGDLDKGLEYKEKALKIREAILRPNHPDLASSYDSVGISYDAKGDLDKGLEYKEKALKILEAILPPNHPDLAASYNNVGASYHAKGDLARGLEYFEKALKIREAILPPNHPDLATSYNNVGSSCHAKGGLARGLEYKEKALKIREAILPLNHPDLARSYNNVGLSYEAKGDLARGLEYQENALKILEAILPLNHPDLAASYNNVGTSYHAKGDLARGLEYFEKALKIQEAMLPNHPNLATSYNNVGSSYEAKGGLDKGLEYFEKALKIREAILPPNHPDLANSYNNVGFSYHTKGDPVKAKAYIQKAVAIAQVELPADHPERLRYENNLKGLI